jgi:hypothetical protein
MTCESRVVVTNAKRSASSTPSLSISYPVRHKMHYLAMTHLSAAAPLLPTST